MTRTSLAALGTIGALLALAAPAAATCAARLGPAAHLYTTAAFADDLDAVRAALGLRKVSLYGVSYGTYAALAYARRHPGGVEQLILDSVLDQQLADDRFGLEGF